jgi:hypothetical protein
MTPGPSTQFDLDVMPPVSMALALLAPEFWKTSMFSATLVVASSDTMAASFRSLSVICRRFLVSPTPEYRGEPLRPP